MTKLSKKICGLVLVGFLATTSVVNAQNRITSPINATSVEQILIQLIKWILGLAALLALLALIVGGVKIIISFGNDKSVGDGKNIIKWAVYGLVVVAGSYLILTTVTGFLGVAP